MEPLQNKVALVTGASRGIGAATAILLAQAGATQKYHDERYFARFGADRCHKAPTS